MSTTPDFSDRMRRWVHDATWNVATQFDGLSNLAITNIASLVARSFNIMVSDITSHSLFWVDVAARQITIVLACRFTDMTTDDIGKWCGVRELSVDRACAQYDNIVDSIFADLDVSIPPRRLSMNSRDLTVLRALYSSSIDGEFSCPEDVVPRQWTRELGTRTLNRLKDAGLSESEVGYSNSIWWRITAAGRKIIDDLRMRERAVIEERKKLRLRQTARVREELVAA